jgi:HlyD family secretion protein
MKPSTTSPWLHKHWTKLLAAAGALLLLSIAQARLRAPVDQPEEGPQPTFAVQRGPLTISILQSGTIQAMEQQIIASEVEGQPTIIYLIEEGARVKKDDLLVQLDASALQDNLVEQQIRVQNAEAAYIRARENLAVIKNQAASDISLTELNHKFAKEDLTQYTEGRYKQDLMSAESAIKLSEEELQLGNRKLEWSEKLFQENYISQSELDADRLSCNRAKLNLEMAKSSKRLLEDFTYTRQLAKLQSDVEQTRQALERAKLRASADIVQAQATLTANEAEWHKQQSKESKNKDQIAKTRICAPREGLVVYATSVKSSGVRGGGQAPLEAGQQVRERQELIYLPTADEMMAAVQVHESNMEKIRLGLPVIVTVEALKGRSFVGKISRIAPLPDAASMWMNPDLKVYQTEIQIEGRHPELRTGMSCMAEIIVEQHADALYVPVQAVLRVGGTPTVYVVRGGRSEPVPVEVGLDNNRMIRILKGLDAKQTVLLNPPLKEAAKDDNRLPGNGEIDQSRLNSMLKDAAKPAAAAPLSTNAGPALAADAGAQPAERATLSPEQRAERRKKFESMTPEQRKERMDRPGGSRTGGDRSGGGDA